MQTGAQLMVAFTGYVTAVLVGRQLGPAAYGAYGMVYSVLLAFEIVGRLGLPQALTKLVAERQDGRLAVERTGLTCGGIVYLLLFGLFWLGEAGWPRRCTSRTGPGCSASPRSIFPSTACCSWHWRC